METITSRETYIPYFILILILFSITTAYAAEKDSAQFKISNIYVSEKNGNLVDSQTLAILNGSREAFSKLILKINANSDKSKIDHCLMKFKNIDSLVESYSIESERMTSRSYSGYVTFVFKPQGVESFMNSCGLNYASVSPGTILFVPIVIDQGNYSMINQEENPDLFDIISNIGEKFNLLELKPLYVSNLLEMQQSNLKQITEGSYNEVENILQSTGASSILVAIVESTTPRKIVIDVKMLTKNEHYHNTLTYEKQNKEDNKSFLKRAIDSTLQNIDAVWKRGFKDKTENVFSSGVMVEMQTPADWSKISKILNSIDIIKQYKFQTITNDSVELEIKYSDSPIALSQKLYENSIAIFKRGDRTVMKIIQN